MAHPNLKRTLLSSAITLACYGGGANAACPGTVNGAEGPCALGGAESVTITATGSLPFIDIAPPGSGDIDNAGVVGGPGPGNTRALEYMGDLGGNLNNSGTVRNVAVEATTSVAAVFIAGELTGTLDNTGTILGESFVGDTGASWNSEAEKARGIVIDGGDLSGTLNNSGLIAGEARPTANTWASATGLRIESGDLSGTLNNTGTIRARTTLGPGVNTGGSEWASNFGVYVDGDVTGTLNNSGHVVAEYLGNGQTKQGATAYGIYVDGSLGPDAMLDNSGTVKAFVDADLGGTAYAIYLDDDLSGALTNSGVLHAEVLAPTSGGGVAGLVIEGELSGLLKNTGTIHAREVGTKWGTGYGVYVDDDLTDTGVLMNTGTVTVEILNTLSEPTENRVTAGAYGIYVHDTVAGMLDNRGTVTATANADASANPTASWASANAYGIFADSDVTGTLSNSGAVNVSATVKAGQVGSDWGVSAVAIGIGVESGLDGQLVNHGSVSATASATVGGRTDTKGFGAEAYGIYIDGDVGASSAITTSGVVEASATVAGGNGMSNTKLRAYGVYIDGDLNGLLDNSGTISAKVTGLADPARTAEFAVYIDGDSSAGVFSNRGTVIGAVQMNGGILNLNGGSISGPITSVNLLDVNIGGVQTSSQTDLFGANVDDFKVVDGGDWQLDTGMVDVATFEVMSGGRLTFTGNATLAEDVPNAGTVSVSGGKVGTIMGDYTHAVGGTFETSSTAPNNFGRLVVTGTADLSASNQVHAQVNGILANGQVDDVLEAGTLVAGPLTTTDDSLFYDITAIVDGNTIDLNVERGVLVTEAVIGANLPYAVGAAAALDALLDAGGNGGAIDPALEALAGLQSAGEVAVAVAELVPPMAGQAVLAQMQVINLFSGVVGHRLTGGPGLSAGDGGMYESGAFWLKPFGGYQDLDARGNVPGLDAQTHGLAAGADFQLSDRLLLGAGFAWSDTQVEGKTLQNNQLDIQSYQWVVYGDYDLNPTDFVESYAVFGFSDTESQRDMSLAPRAVADYDSFFTRIYGGIGRTYRQNDQWSFAPVLTMRYTYIDQDSYTETGAGGLNLAVGDNDEDSLILGIDGVSTFTFGRTFNHALTLRGGLGYDVLTDQALVTSTFTGGGAAFATQGAEPDEVVYRAGIGLKSRTDWGFTSRIDYEFEGRKDNQSHGGSLTFRWEF